MPFGRVAQRKQHCAACVSVVKPECITECKAGLWARFYFVSSHRTTNDFRFGAIAQISLVMGGLAIAFAVALLIHFILFGAARRLDLRKQTVLAQSLLYCEKPTRLILMLLLGMGSLPFLPATVIVKSVLAHIIGILLIGAIAWLLVAVVDVVEAVLPYRYSIEMADNLAARSVRTQVQVLRRIIVMMIIIVAIAGVLMTFPSIRHIGESLFASAGLAAVVAAWRRAPCSPIYWRACSSLSPSRSAWKTLSSSKASGAGSRRSRPRLLWSGFWTSAG
jgi:hypothetical protein